MHGNMLKNEALVNENKMTRMGVVVNDRRIGSFYLVGKERC